MRTKKTSGSAWLLAAALAISAGATAADWKVDHLVPGGPFKGIHGLGVGPDGLIYVGSVIGQALHTVDPRTGATAVFVPPTAGLADDVEFGPDGTIFWTGFANGTLNARSPGSGTRVIASGLPGLNSLAMDAKGRLFATQVFAGDALWEMDPTGEKPPRLVMKDMGGLNGFDFGPDGRLCGPLWFKQQVVCIDVDAARLEVVAEGFKVPAAANFDSQGRLHAIDNETGEIFRIDINARTRERVAMAPTNLDNLAFDAADRLYVTNMSDNAIYEVPLDGRPLRTVISSPLTLPGGIALQGDTLYVADHFTMSKVDTKSGTVQDIDRSLLTNGYPSTIAASATRIASASVESGVVQLRDRTSERRLAVWTGMARPGAIAVIDERHVAVAEIGTGKLLALDASRPDAREVLAEGLEQPMGLVRRGSEWFVSESAAGRVSALGANGTRRVVVEDLQQPEGLAFMPDGRLVVAEAGTGRVLLVDTPTGERETIARRLPFGIADAPGAPPGIIPTGVAVDGAGTVFISSDRESSVLRLRATGKSAP
jgi:sugar lactone lactonase YvrE